SAIALLPSWPQPYGVFAESGQPDDGGHGRHGATVPRSWEKTPRAGAVVTRPSSRRAVNVCAGGKDGLQQWGSGPISRRRRNRERPPPPGPQQPPTSATGVSIRRRRPPGPPVRVRGRRWFVRSEVPVVRV